jgi:hypothetical protein
MPAYLYYIVLLRDVFHIGLVIGPKSAVLAWGSIQHYVIKFVSDLQQVSYFFLGTLVSSTNKTYCHHITEILLKVASNAIALILTLKQDAR